jgi:hypothetical protein
MPEYEFTLVIDGSLDDENTIDALFEAGCDDATFGSISNTGFGDFAREAATFALAVISAVSNVESVDGLTVRRVEPDDLVTIPEIAERLDRSAESIRLLANGERGGGTFPPPISHLRTRHRLWRWIDVATWAGLADEEAIANAAWLVAVNALLELRAVRGWVDQVLIKELQNTLAA